MKSLLVIPVLLLTAAAWGGVNPTPEQSGSGQAPSSGFSFGMISVPPKSAPSQPTGPTTGAGDPTTGSGGTTAPPSGGTTAPPSGGTTAPPSGGQTWYVNGGGGTRYSVNQTGGQCNGTSAAPYPGVGTNQNCAFKDIRSLWTDGSYAAGTTVGVPGWGWIGSSGDTYLIDCSGGAQCRIGQNGPNSGDYYGLAGDPYDSGVPLPINGTANAHTRILGANFANCTSPDAKAHINGGFGVSSVFSLQGSSYVDIACFDITDFSSCGLSAQSNTCNKQYPIDDFATFGISTNNATTNTTITDVNIHGMAYSGMAGPTGDGVVVTRVSVSGNPGAGWNMDSGDGTTGSGHLTLSYFTAQWNGCAEEYPVVDALPYADCTDDGSGGYGDGIGTATVASDPGWVISVDHSVAAYNTQDGFDLLHLQGNGSTLSISDSEAYGNMGQQLKIGAAGTATNNLFVGNCNALRQAIPGTPSGYNSKLSDFCRASDVPVVVAVADGGTTKYLNNTLYTANNIGLEVTPDGSCTTSCYLQYENNIFLGFQNDAANGYPSGGNGRFPTPIYFDANNVFGLSGSSFSNNLTFNPRDNWACPQTGWNEQNAVCEDPGLVDETFHLFGIGNMSPSGSSSVVLGRGIALPGLLTDFVNGLRSTISPTIGAYEQTAASSPAQ